MISGMNSWKTMNSGVPRSVLAKNSYQNSYMNSWKIMNSYTNSWKNICPVKEFLYMNSYVNSYMNSYMKTFFMNSYMNSYMNSCMWILKIHIRKNIIWRSGCSKYGDQGVPDLWRRGSGESLSQWGGLWRTKAGRGAIGVRRAAASYWTASIEAGCGEWRRAVSPEWLVTLVRRAWARSILSLLGLHFFLL